MQIWMLFFILQVSIFVCCLFFICEPSGGRRKVWGRLKMHLLLLRRAEADAAALCEAQEEDADAVSTAEETELVVCVQSDEVKDQIDSEAKKVVVEADKARKSTALKTKRSPKMDRTQPK